MSGEIKDVAPNRVASFVTSQFLGLSRIELSGRSSVHRVATKYASYLHVVDL